MDQRSRRTLLKKGNPRRQTMAYEIDWIDTTKSENLWNG